MVKLHCLPQQVLSPVLKTEKRLFRGCPQKLGTKGSPGVMLCGEKEALDKYLITKVISDSVFVRVL